jgi:DNA-binding transcriptional LysR family regulator
MELKQMLYYTTIVEEGTFQAAARKLNMTQPPLSAQIRQLEEEIGAPLLIRGSRHVRMTDTGDFFYRRAKNMLQLADTTEKELKDRRTGKSGTIRLGVISSASGSLLCRFIRPFSVRYPNVHFELTESNTYELLDLLSADLLDMALVRTPFGQNPSFQIRELETEELCAIGVWENGESCAETDSSAESRAWNACQNPVRPDKIPLGKLRTRPLIIYRRWKKLLDTCFSETGEIPHYYCIADDARTCLSLARAGMGYAVVPLSAAAPAEEAEEIAASQIADDAGRAPAESTPSFGIRKIIDPVINSTICSVTSTTAYRSTALELFLDTLEER